MDQTARVFISYSRQDDVTANRIYDALKASGLTVLIDTKDILSLEEWRPRLSEMIRSSDVVLCLLSHAYLESETCKWELSFAGELNKRIVPVALEDVGQRLPGSIEHINYIPLYGGVDFDAQTENLRRTFDVDIGWVREHTQLAELANRWENGKALEMRGKELHAAQEWLKSRPKDAPETTPAQLRYICASEKKARRSRYIVLSIAAVIALSLAVIAFLQAEQRNMRALEAMNKIARQARNLAHSDPVEAIRLAIRSWPEAPHGGLTGPVDALTAVGTAIANQRLRVVINSRKGDLLQAVYTPDQQNVVVAYSSNIVQFADAATGALNGKPIPTNGPVATIAFSADSKRVAIFAGNSVEVRDMDTKYLVAELEAPDSELATVVFSPDGNSVVTLSDGGDIRFWDLDTKKETAPVFRADEPVVNLFFGQDKSTLIVVTDSAIRTLEFPEGTENAAPILTGGRNTAAAISADGRYVAASSGNTIGVWKIASRSVQLEPLAVYPEGTEISSIAFSPDNSQVVSVANGKSVLVSAITDGAETTKIRASQFRFTDAAFSPDGTRIITSSEASARIYEYALGRSKPVGPNSVFGAVMRASRASEAPYLGSLNAHHEQITASVPQDTVITLSDTVTGQAISNEILHHRGIISSIAFSPDDRFLSTTDDDGVIRVWHAQTARLLFTFEHPGDLIDVSLTADFTPDARSLVSWRKENDMLAWNIDLSQGSLMQIACRTLPFEDGLRFIVRSGETPEPEARPITDACSTYSAAQR